MSNKNIEKVVKVTKKERFAELLAIPAVASNQDLVDFINHEVDLLTRKNASGEKTVFMVSILLSCIRLRDDIGNCV